MSKEEAIEIVLTAIDEAYPINSSNSFIEEHNKAIEAFYLILEEDNING